MQCSAYYVPYIALTIHTTSLQGQFRVGSGMGDRMLRWATRHFYRLPVFWRTVMFKLLRALRVTDSLSHTSSICTRQRTLDQASAPTLILKTECAFRCTWADQIFIWCFCTWPLEFPVLNFTLHSWFTFLSLPNLRLGVSNFCAHVEAQNACYMTCQSQIPYPYC